MGNIRSYIAKLCLVLLVVAIPCFYVLETRFYYARLDAYLEDHAIPDDIAFSSGKSTGVRLNPSGSPDFYYACIPSEASYQQKLQVSFPHVKILELDGHSIESGDEIYDLASTFDDNPVSMKMYAPRGELLYEGYVEFHFAQDVPSMYLTTSENAIDIVNATDYDDLYKPRIDADVMVVDAYSNVDTITSAKIYRHGNTSFDGFNLKPYNMSLNYPASLLGMTPGRRWVLKSNGQYPTVALKNQAASDVANLMNGLPAPEGRYVNIYLNGRYLGFYLLCQKIGVPDLPKADNVRYLIERDVKYYRRPSNFTYDESGIAVHYPETLSDDELDDLSDLVSSAMDAINDDSDYERYIDVDSFIKMYILQDLFVQTDIDGDSSYFYVGEDGKLYAGPMWDFDCTCAHITTGPYHGDLTINSRYFYDFGKLFFQPLNNSERFMAAVADYYNTNLSDRLHAYLDQDLDRDISAIESSVYMSDVSIGVSEHGNPTDTDASALRDWLERRVGFLDEYYRNPDEYNLVRFHFAWGNMTTAVRKGEAVGYMPDDQHYGNYEDFWGEIMYFVTEDGERANDDFRPSAKSTDLYAVYTPESYAWAEYEL